ncbi:MAG: ATP-dependent helicase [Bacteroidetes bacterium]|jgi:superfamily I DNA/RNA helicase|nr:ATP-dependent helicase [Bacteroidota bacterium]
MKLTQEQWDIINSSGNIKINAVAGSGKTTTVIEYAKTRPKTARILYLAFNRSVKSEAKKKFEEKGMLNVKVETAHSLAHKNVVYRHNYKVRNQGYKTHEIAELLNITGDGEKHTEYVVANHINKFIAYFCNSDKRKVQDLNYLDTISDEKVHAFVAKFYPYIETQARLLLNKMDKGEIEITHDFYLKKFQLGNPQLNYDYILFDEGQDASPAMLDIFLKQEATKVIVGDTHQQIYGWRHAVNSLEKADFKTFHLSTSFRFSQDIASLANAILDWKAHLAKHQPVSIKGEGDHKAYKTKAIIARTNLGLLLKAIEYVTEKKKIKHIYFEGNINSYTYAEDGASLYDVLNLYNGKNHLIRDALIKSMKDLGELEEYIDKTEDVQLKMMVEIVKEYGNEIPDIIKAIKEKHIDGDQKGKADIIFSTVHRCKGMEYDAIQLVNDFITEESIEKLKAGSKEKELNVSKLNEEINLLYVAVTRTKNSIHIHQDLLPKEFPNSPRIYPVKDEPAGPPQFKETKIKPDPKSSREQSKELPGKAYAPWTKDLDDKLTEMYCMGIHVKDIAKQFGRTKGAIASRVKKLELEENYD